MRPDSAAAQITAGVLTAVFALAAGLVWDVPARWWRWPVRVVPILVSVVLAAATVGIGVNRQLYLYPTWADVFGTGTSATSVVPATTDPQGSEVVEMVITGAQSHISLSAYVYLPAAYRSAAGSHERFPVIETFAGFPGSPLLWLNSLKIQQMMDTEIEAGRMAPTIAVIPYQTEPPTHDSECVNAVGGQQFDTFLGVDVPQAVTENFRVRTDRFGWATLGVSTGGFCAVNLAMRHPDRFGVAVSLSGYFTAITDRTTGDLYRGSGPAHDENSPLWRLQHLPVPELSIFLGCAADDKSAVNSINGFEAAVRPPLSVSKMIIKQGGHSGNVWKAMEPAVLDWMAARMAGPEPNAPA